LRPLLQGWRLQVKRANEAQKIYVQVEKRLGPGSDHSLNNNNDLYIYIYNIIKD
jgi:hypothetical protein